VIRQVRVRGLLIGVEIDGNARDVVQGCMARGVLVLTAGDRVVRFTPPLIITQTDVDRAVAVLDQVLAEVLA
jgi:acetylornithine/N-succinyldiaminopimelate aminotransferase